MPFCANCGAEVVGRFCARCGATVGEPGGPTPGAVPPNPPGAYPPPPAGGYSTPPPPLPGASSGLADNVAGALCYVLGLITGVIFLVLSPYNQNRTIRFHAFQSIFFNIAWFILSMIVSFVQIFLTLAMGFRFPFLSTLVGLAGFALWLLLIYKAYNGEKFMLPVIGPLAEKQA
jgi:uncharacterized membrane protein